MECLIPIRRKAIIGDHPAQGKGNTSLRGPFCRRTGLTAKPT
jgi:hypothetical protein